MTLTPTWSVISSSFQMAALTLVSLDELRNELELTQRFHCPFCGDAGNQVFRRDNLAFSRHQFSRHRDDRMPGDHSTLIAHGYCTKCSRYVPLKEGLHKCSSTGLIDHSGGSQPVPSATASPNATSKRQSKPSPKVAHNAQVLQENEEEKDLTSRRRFVVLVKAFCLRPKPFSCVSCLVSRVWCLVSSVSRLVSRVSCLGLVSHVSYLVSCLVSCVLGYNSGGIRTKLVR